MTIVMPVGDHKKTKRGQARFFAVFRARFFEARLFADLAAAGETVIITKRGKPIDLEALRQLTASMPPQAAAALPRLL